MMRPPSHALVFLALVAAAPVSAAQDWSLEAQAGKLRAALDPSTPASQHAVLGLRFDRPNTGFRLSAGAPASLNQDLWGALGLWRRAAVRRSGWVAGFDLSGNGLLLRRRQPAGGGPGGGGGGLFDPPAEMPPPQPLSGHAFAGQVLPLVGYEAAAVRIHARAGVSYYAARFAEPLNRAVRVADLQISYQPGPPVALIPTVRRFEAAGEEGSTYAGLTAVIMRGRAGIWGTVGQWLAGPAEDPTAWSVGGSLRIHSRATVLASARRDTFDPLFLGAPQTAWSVGLSVPIGPRPALSAPPVPASYERGVATVRLPAVANASAGTLAIAGDFNGWKAVPMQRVGEHWVYTVAVAPGVYHYAFVNARGEWFVPKGVPGRKDDGMGGHVAVLVVE